MLKSLIFVGCFAFVLAACQDQVAMTVCSADQQAQYQEFADDVPNSLVEMRGMTWTGQADMVTRFYPEMRVIGPEDMVTMDVVGDRLNVYLDCEGRIAGMRFG